MTVRSGFASKNYEDVIGKTWLTVCVIVIGRLKVIVIGKLKIYP